MDLQKQSLNLHQQHQGKIATQLKVPLSNKTDLSLAYTPGVAAVCQAIKDKKNDVYKYTNKGNLVAIVTDGSAVLGLGNIGPEAAYPVMEGKAALFKQFADVDAVPVCLNTQNTEEIINIVKNLEPTFGGINLEDIAAPRCFEIEKRLKETMSIPVFHDDQHGTAIVVLAGIINALKIVKKNKQDIKVVINGAGAAGLAISQLLLDYGITDIIVLDSVGAISRDRTDLTPVKQAMAEKTNQAKLRGGLENVLQQADVFIGVSVANCLKPDWLKLMKPEQIIFAMANPVPEIDPLVAKKMGAKVVATGRSDVPNQINNVLAFPGIFRGLFDNGVKQVSQELKIRAATALAGVIADQDLTPEYIIPDPFDQGVVPAVAGAFKR